MQGKEANVKITIYQQEKNTQKKRDTFSEEQGGRLFGTANWSPHRRQEQPRNGIAAKQTRVLKKMFIWLMPNEYDSVGRSGHCTTHFVNRKKKVEICGNKRLQNSLGIGTRKKNTPLPLPPPRLGGNATRMEKGAS